MPVLVCSPSTVERCTLPSFLQGESRVAQGRGKQVGRRLREVHPCIEPQRYSWPSAAWKRAGLGAVGRSKAAAVGGSSTRGQRGTAATASSGTGIPLLQAAKQPSAGAYPTNPRLASPCGDRMNSRQHGSWWAAVSRCFSGWCLPGHGWFPGWMCGRGGGCVGMKVATNWLQHSAALSSTAWGAQRGKRSDGCPEAAVEWRLPAAITTARLEVVSPATAAHTIKDTPEICPSQLDLGTRAANLAEASRDGRCTTCRRRIIPMLRYRRPAVQIAAFASAAEHAPTPSRQTARTRPQQPRRRAFPLPGGLGWFCSESAGKTCPHRRHP